MTFRAGSSEYSSSSSGNSFLAISMAAPNTIPDTYIQFWPQFFFLRLHVGKIGNFKTNLNIGSTYMPSLFLTLTPECNAIILDGITDLRRVRNRDSLNGAIRRFVLVIHDKYILYNFGPGFWSGSYDSACIQLRHLGCQF